MKISEGRRSDQRDKTIDPTPENIPSFSPLDLQADWLARRYGLPATHSIIIVELAFGGLDRQ